MRIVSSSAERYFKLRPPQLSDFLEVADPADKPVSRARREPARLITPAVRPAASSAC